MQKDILIQISHHIKERRRQKRITIQELADRAGVSKGLISQIENSRTIPSLLVLINIIQALEIDLNVFFKDIKKDQQAPPFGGIKDSGLGTKEGVIEAIKCFTYVKTFSLPW